MIYFSKTTNGFYFTGINRDIPRDKVEVSVKAYESLMMDISRGKTITPDAEGNPIAIDPEGQTEAQKQEGFLITKKHLLKTVNELISPLQNAVDIEEATDDEKSLLVAYKKYAVTVNRTEYSTIVSWPSLPEQI